MKPAYDGYRFEYRRRSVVMSGDAAKNPGVIAAARGADMADIPSYHTKEVQAAEAANKAAVRMLVRYT